MRGTRARITPVDVVLFAMSIALFVFLAEPLYTVLGDADLGTGTGLLFQMIPPALVMTVLVVIYRVSIGGT